MTSQLKVCQEPDHICWVRVPPSPLTQLFATPQPLLKLRLCRCPHCYKGWGQRGQRCSCPTTRPLSEGNVCLSRGEAGFVLSTRPPLSLCAGNKLSSGSSEARNCKLSGEAQRRDKGSVFAGSVQGGWIWYGPGPTPEWEWWYLPFYGELCLIPFASVFTCKYSCHH